MTTSSEPAAAREPGRRGRDAQGRPLNTRPRDALGRPLAPGSLGVPTTPATTPLAPRDALREARRLLESGRPFHAHEVLEAAWKAAPRPERELWRGLAQLAVGLTHAARGNTNGASRLLLRGAHRIGPYAASPPYDVPVRDLVSWSQAVADRIERDGIGALPADALTPPPLAR